MKKSEIVDNIFAHPDSGFQPCRRLARHFNLIFQKVFDNHRQGFQPLTGLFGNSYNWSTPTAAISPVGG